MLEALTFRTDFLTEQKKYEKVRTAFREKEMIVGQKLSENNLEKNNLNILIVVYKDSDELEIYAKKKTETSYRIISSVEVCARSGQLGPKRKQGDLQVPEGFYKINQFNPVSNFYLSLGINYPNQADRKKSKAADPGNNIFIHGSCVTIGCLPLTDDKIKELYVYAVLAKNNGQSDIPVYIFPFRMTDQNFSSYKEKCNNNKELIDFWTNLKTGYDRFTAEKNELKITIDAKGDYKF
ncbi:MAG: L,D-transpeptidase family protein [Bacteroidales bacterium]|nr:L,D-transpeptidase family protein [Bacteroidales bacterium]